MKKIIALFLTTSFVFNLFASFLTPVFAQSESNSDFDHTPEYTVIHDYIIKCGDKYYDMSTREGGLDFIYDHRDVSMQFVVNIIENLKNRNNYVEEPLISLFNDGDVTPGGGASTYTYFHSMSWISRSDGINLSLNPKNSVRLNILNVSPGWEEVKKWMSSSPNWYNESSLNGQYWCHYYFAGTKTNWNLSPEIPDKGNAFQWVIDKCN